MDAATIRLLIEIFTFIGGGLGVVIAVVWNLAKWKDELRRDNGEKISRVYTRLDETKTWFESMFVRKDMCSALHANTANAVIEMKTEMKAEINHLAEEIDKLKDLIIKKGV